MLTAIISIYNGYIASYSGLNSKCWQGIILNLIESTLIGVFYFLPLFFVNELHFTVTTSGLVISCFGLGTILGGFYGGKLSDRFSPGVVSVVSLFLQGFVFLGLLICKIPSLLMIVLFFMGIASYGFITSNHLWVLQYCQRDEFERKQALNILNMASNFGLGISALIITSCMHYGFQYLLIFSCLILFLMSSYFLQLSRNDPCNRVAHNNKNISTIENKKIITLILVCLFLVGFIIFQSSTYAIYIQDLFPSQGINAVGMLFAMNTFLVVFLQTPLGHFSEPYNKLKVAGIGAFLLGGGMVILTLLPSLSLAIFANVIYTIGEMLFFSVAQSICYENAAPHKKGHMIGIYRVVYACSRVVAPVTGAFIYQQWHGNVLWYVCGSLGIFCLFLCRLGFK